MNHLALRFTGKLSPELTAIRAERGGEAVHMVRGKTSGAFRNQPTFQWTSAVKALAVLLCTAKFETDLGAHVTGDRGSLAAALDFAISKPPLWLRELFGESASEEPLANRYFLRTNPERKRGGPVTIALNTSRLSLSKITISLDGEEIQDFERGHQLLRILRGSVDRGFSVPSATDTNDEIPQLDPHSSSCSLPSLYDADIERSLSRTDVFSKQWLSTQLDQVNRNSLLRRYVKDPSEALNALSKMPKSSTSLGMADLAASRRVLEMFGPIRILSSAVAPGFIALATYLKNVGAFPIDLDFCFPYATEIVRQIMEEGESPIPTVFCSGLGPCAPFLESSQDEYRPLMVGPCLSHRIVTHRSNKSANVVPASAQSDFIFVSENPTSVLFYFDELKRKSLVGHRVIPTHGEPHEVMKRAVSGDSFSTLLWFPLYHFHEELGATLNNFIVDPHVEMSLIFANRAARRNAILIRTIETLLRDAWLTLLENPRLRKQIASDIAFDPRYSKYIGRCAGLHHVPDRILANSDRRTPIYS